MKRDVGTIERAFQLAREGTCSSMSDIKLKLKQERHEAVEGHLAGPSLSRQLQALMRAAKA